MKKILTLFAAAVLALSSCNKGDFDSIIGDEIPPYETNHGFMLLRNYSSDDTVWYIPDKEHADNLPTDKLTEWQQISIYTVEAHQSYELTYDSNDNYITPLETYGVDDEMTFYIFKKYVWDTHSWSELVAGKLWECKCTLSVEEALAQNRTLTYPMP